MFCIPHAGGSMASYSKLRFKLLSHMDVHNLELPGRGRRFEETFCENMEEAVYDLYNQIADEISEDPYVIFGHSMGSWLAFELYFKIKQEGLRLPNHLICSGNVTPSISSKSNSLQKLNNKEFEEKIQEIGGLYSRYLNNEDVKKKYLPVLRADFNIVENYIFKGGILDCNLTVLGGKSDPLTMGQLGGWSNLTKKRFNIVEFDGGHFFLLDNVNTVSEVIIQYLSYLL
nr:thioesterase domain-containing protein [Clostridium sp. BNL1100]